MTESTQETVFAHWCIVELMGHQTIAGKVTEENHFGTALMRVDVPETEDRPGFTKFYGATAIYGITPVEEEIARAIAKAHDNRPIEEWRLRRLLTLPDDEGSAEGADFVDTSSLEADEARD